MRGIAEVRLGADTGLTLPLLGVESLSGNSFTLHVDGASLVPPRTPVLLLRLRTTWHRPDSQPCTLEISCDRAELQGHRIITQVRFTVLGPLLVSLCYLSRVPWKGKSLAFFLRGFELHLFRLDRELPVATVTSELGVTICVPRERYFGQDVAPWNSLC